MVDNAALRTLLLNLPKCFNEWWVDMGVLYTALTMGGISLLPREALHHCCVLGFRQTLIPARDRYRKNHTYYCFGTLDQRRFSDARDQLDALARDPNLELPRISPNYFLSASRPDEVKQAVRILKETGFINTDKSHIVTPLPSLRDLTAVVTTGTNDPATNESETENPRTQTPRTRHCCGAPWPLRSARLYCT